MKYYVILFLLILHGCTALHIPQSEIILMEEPPEEEEIAAGFSLNSGLWSTQIQPYAIDEHQRVGLREKLATRNFYGLSLTGILWANPRTAMGISFFSGGIGLDYTQRFSQKTYVTVMGNIARNFEGIIQTPLYRNSKTGLALGAFYRTERHGLLQECSGPICLGNEIGSHFRISAFGIRLNQYLYDTKARMRLRFSIGYSPELKGVVISGGLYSPLPRKAFDRGAF